MAIVQYKETLMENLSSIPILEGQLIYCTDTETSLYDTADGSRIEAIRFVIVETELEKECLPSPVRDRVYFVKETELVYLYTGLQWVEAVDTVEINDIVDDVDLIVPVQLEQAGTKLSPQVLSTSVRNPEGLTLEEMIQETLSHIKFGFGIGSVIAQEEMQRSFEIPFPFPDYIRLGNSFICYLGSVWVDPIRYTVSGNRLLFNNEDDGVGLGRKLSFIFLYNTTSPSDMEMQTLDGRYIAEGTIPLSKLESAAEMITYSSFAQKVIQLSDTVEANTSFINSTTYYYGGSRASINLHLTVKDYDKLYNNPIGTIDIDYLPNVPIENFVISTDRGPVDLSIDETGHIWIGMNLKPIMPTRIDGTIPIML